MPTTMQNGLTLGQGQPVKSISKNTADFIAACASTASATGTFNLASAAIALQAVLVRLGVLQ